MESTLAAHKEAVTREADRYIRVMAATEGIEELRHELRELSQSLREDFLAGISSHSEKLARCRGAAAVVVVVVVVIGVVVMVIGSQRWWWWY